MGIYESVAPCGCISETYTMFEPFRTAIICKCLAHGGNPIIIAGRAARKWAGPKNPYADPEEFVRTTNDRD